MIPRSVRHRLAPRGPRRHVLSRHSVPWMRYTVPVVSPHVDRLRDAAVEPCWRTSEAGREFQATLSRIVNK